MAKTEHCILIGMLGHFVCLFSHMKVGAHYTAVERVNIVLVCEGFSRRSLLLQPWHRIYAISKRLAARGDLSVFIISDRNENTPSKEEIEGITIARIARSRLTGFFPREKLAEVLRENHADIIIWCGAPSSAVHLNHHANRMEKDGIPIVWEIDMDIQNLKDLNRLSFRELVGSGHSLLLPKLLLMALSKFMIKRVANSESITRIIVPSQSIKNSFNEVGVKPDKIDVIPSTIEKEDFQASDVTETSMLRRELSFGQDDFIVTYFGSPCTMRGTDTVINGMKRILVARKNMKLLILSRRDTSNSLIQPNASNNPDGQHCADEEKYLKMLTKKLGIEKNVQIISGIMSKSELRNYLLASDVVALPFKHVFSEPPLCVLEAMSLGKAVVTTNLNTLSEIVGRNRGILIQPNRADKLAQAVLHLADHPEESARVGKNAQRFIAGLNDWHHVALQFPTILEDVLK